MRGPATWEQSDAGTLPMRIESLETRCLLTGAIETAGVASPTHAVAAIEVTTAAPVVVSAKESAVDSQPVMLVTQTPAVTAQVGPQKTGPSVTDAAVSLSAGSVGSEIVFTPIADTQERAIPTVTLKLTDPSPQPVSMVAANEAGDLMSYLDQAVQAVDTNNTAVVSAKVPKSQAASSTPAADQSPPPTVQPAAQPAADHIEAIKPAPANGNTPAAMTPLVAPVVAITFEPLPAKHKDAESHRAAGLGAAMLLVTLPKRSGKAKRCNKRGVARGLLVQL